MGKAKIPIKNSQTATPRASKVSYDELEQKVHKQAQLDDSYKLEKTKLLAKNKLILEIWGRLKKWCVSFPTHGSTYNSTGYPTQEYTIFTEDRIQSVSYNGAWYN